MPCARGGRAPPSAQALAHAIRSSRKGIVTGWPRPRSGLGAKPRPRFGDAPAAPQSTASLKPVYLPSFKIGADAHTPCRRRAFARVEKRDAKTYASSRTPCRPTTHSDDIRNDLADRGIEPVTAIKP